MKSLEDIEKIKVEGLTTKDELLISTLLSMAQTLEAINRQLSSIARNTSLIGE
jgi:hypothetical protein